MEIRNQRFNSDGSIDLEFNLPGLGWLPFTARDDDPEDFGRQIHAEALTLDPAPYVAPVATPEDLAAELLARRAIMVLSRRQLLIGLVREGLITPAEARAPSHVPPAAIEAMFARMPEPEQTDARITWANFTEARRLDPLVPLIAAVAPVPLDDAAIDAFFTTYATF